MLFNLSQGVVSSALSTKGNMMKNLLFSSELMAHCELLLVEMFEGNASKRPSRSWSHFGILDTILCLGFPSFQKDRMDLRRQSLQMMDWLKDGRGNLVFVQQASVLFHFKSLVWEAQKALISRHIDRTFDPDTESGVFLQLDDIMEHMTTEWSVFVTKVLGIELTQQMNIKRLNGQEADQASVYAYSCMEAYDMFMGSEFKFTKL